jgi:type III pantothenate kinase
LILLVDIGNSRVKWATWTGDTLGPQSVAEHRLRTDADWKQVLSESGATRVIAACVGDSGAKTSLAKATRAVLGGDPEFVLSTAEAAGIRNGYTHPAQLGVDRWLAVIGAYHRHRAACCVVDAGTALTVDAVDASGVHHGGYIVPGPQLMIGSLLTGTSELADRWTWTPAAETSDLARNTRDAIERGCLLALARLVDEVCSRVSRATGTVPVVVVTGGAGPVLLPWLAPTADHVPDLVLQGLARIVTRSTVPGPTPAVEVAPR